MNNLLTFRYWFSLRPGQLIGLAGQALIIFVLALVVLTFIFWLIKSRNKKNIYSKFWQACYYFSLSNAIIGLLLLFFNYEMAPFLSARFWFVLWLAVMVVWLVFIFKIIIVIPKRKSELEKQKEYKKYIP